MTAVLGEFLHSQTGVHTKFESREVNLCFGCGYSAMRPCFDTMLGWTLELITNNKVKMKFA